jgi:hypothetical protein
LQSIADKKSILINGLCSGLRLALIASVVHCGAVTSANFR